MCARLQRNVSEFTVTEVRTASSSPAFVVLEIREHTCPARFSSVVDFCFKKAVLLCNWWSFSQYPFVWHDLTWWSLSCILETKASMRLLFHCCWPAMSLAMKEITWLHSHTKTKIELPNTTQNIVQPVPKMPSYTEYLKFYVYMTTWK